MIKLSNETKVGVLAAVAIGILIYGYNFLRGKDLLSSNTVLTAIYDRVDFLQVSAPIRINGFQVGNVTDIQMQQIDNVMTGKIIVQLRINSGIQVPKNAIARIVQASMLSNPEIELEIKETCNGATCAKTGDILQAQVSGGFVGTIKNELNPMIEKVQGAVGKTIDLGVGKIDSLMAGNLSGITPNGLGTTLANLKSTIARLNSSLGTFDNMLGASSNDIVGTMRNINLLTKSLTDNTTKVSSILANFDKMSATLNDQTLTKVNSSFDNLNSSIGAIKNNLANLDSTLNASKALMNNLQNPDGTLGMLMTNPEFKNKINLLVTDMQLLMQDIRLNPVRYKTILSAKKRPYILPNDDPARQAIKPTSTPK